MSFTATQVAFEIVAKDKASKTFSGLGKSIGGALAAIGIGKLLKDSVNLEAQFGKTMNILKAAAGVPEPQMKKLSDLALKLGADTAFSANDAADAMLELAKAGITTKNIMGGGVAGTLTLAAAGGTDLATAATIGANAMNAFSLEGKDMAKVAAALAGGANASSASVESLGQGLSQVGPGAVNAGLSLQQTVGVLAAFDSAGIKGSDAGTSLKTMLSALVPTTDKARGAMEELGLSFVNANGDFKSITAISEQLHDKMGKLGEAERVRAMKAIFGSDATRAATVLMREGAEGLRGYITATNDQTAAQKMADAAMAGTSGALERLRGSVETAQLKIGQALAPAVQTLANGLAAHLVPAVDKTIAVIGDVVGFLGDHKTATIAAAVAIGALVAVTKVHAAVMAVQAAGGLLKYISATKIVTAVTKTWTAVQWLLNTALIANPIGAVVMGIAALAAGVIVAYQKSETFRHGVEKVGEGLLFMGEYGIKAFRFLLTAAFATFSGILSAADKGLGWVPGMGDKIHSAKKAFDEFGDSTITKLKGVEDKLRSTREELGRLDGKRANVEITATVNWRERGNSPLGANSSYNLTGEQP